MKVAAVIVNHNRLEMLKDCISSLLSGQTVPDTIIVVDNASEDGSVAWLKSQSSITSFCLNHNSGGSYGFTFGMKKALEIKADWIWTMDEDVLVSPNCLTTMLNHLKNHPELDFLVPEVVNTNGELNPNSAPETNNTGLVKTTTFIGTLMKAACLKDVGFPISNMFRFYDDIEFYTRLYKAGKKGHLVAAARITHLSEGKMLNDYYATLNSDHWSRLYLRNMYFYLKQRDGLNMLIKTALKDLFSAKKEQYGKGFARREVFRALIAALKFKPQYGVHDV